MEIKEGLQVKEFYMTILYLIISGFLTPSFYSFSYFFMLDEVGISKFTYSMLTVISYCASLIGA